MRASALVLAPNAERKRPRIRAGSRHFSSRHALQNETIPPATLTHAHRTPICLNHAHCIVSELLQLSSTAGAEEDIKRSWRQETLGAPLQRRESSPLSCAS